MGLFDWLKKKGKISEPIREREIEGKTVKKWRNKYEKGMTFERLGGYEDAIRCYDETLSIAPFEELEEIERKKALNTINEAQSLLQKAKKLGISTKWAEERLNNAKRKLDERDYSNATKLTNGCKRGLEQKINEYKKAAERSAKQSLDFAYSKIKEAERLGINVSSAQDLHRKALSEFDNREYEKAKELAEEAKNIALKRKSEYDSAFKSISEAELAIENAKEFGCCDTFEAEELLNKARTGFEDGNYARSISDARRSEEIAREIKEESKPEIEVVLPEKTFKPNYWKRLNLIVRNKGNAHAKAVKIEFSKEVEVKGLKELNVNSGEEEKLSIILKPNELGDVPLEIKTTYKDADGKEYSAENLFMLNVAEKPAEEPSRRVEEISTKKEEITIERAIYDPCKRDFIEGALPRMKEWVNRYDPGAYWFAISIQNNTDRAIEEWGVELETSSALKIREARVEGIDYKIELHETYPEPFKVNT